MNKVQISVCVCSRSRTQERDHKAPAVALGGMPAPGWVCKRRLWRSVDSERVRDSKKQNHYQDPEMIQNWNSYQAGAPFPELEHHVRSGSPMYRAGAPYYHSSFPPSTSPPMPASAVMSYAMSGVTTHGILRGVLMACLFWMKGEGLILVDWRSMITRHRLGLSHPSPWGFWRRGHLRTPMEEKSEHHFTCI